MKTKVFAIIIALATLVLPQNLCYAQEPQITREYIARKSGDIKSTEEKLNVSYSNLWVTEGNFLRVSFLNGENVVLAQYEAEIDISAPYGFSIPFDMKTLEDTEYIEMQIFGTVFVNNGVKLPFKIKKIGG